jgi:hypothetical protein
MDVSGRIRANLDAGYPCRHDKAVFSLSVGERKLMKYSFVRSVRCTQTRLSEGVYILRASRFPVVIDVTTGDVSESKQFSVRKPSLKLVAASWPVTLG